MMFGMWGFHLKNKRKGNNVKNKEGILYWITGLSGAGKTTIGSRLFYELREHRDNVVLLDGDILKNIVNDVPGYTLDDRKKRALKYAMICKMLTDQNITVICCTIAMFNEVREWNRKNNKGYVEVFLDVPMEVLQKRDQKGLYSAFKSGENKNVSGLDVSVEFPKTPDVYIKNDGSYSIKECVNKILDYEVKLSSDFDRDTHYWNQFYIKKPKIEMPSLFAQEIGKQLVTSRTILDLGCGNGRDSLYFKSLGLNVTAIDASDRAIAMLQEEYANENICFICDDFVCSSVIYAGQYDYCYSRFSLHAINEDQENDMIKNVYKVLKSGGKFFIEVQSVNDDLYGKGECVGKNAYIYNGHYRRFVEKPVLEEKLCDVGFEIKYSSEEKGFAPFEGVDPPVIRIIAMK